MENSKESLLKEIQICCFVLTETRLFLDTHPQNQDAIQFYKMHKEKLTGLQKLWEERYGDIAPMGEMERWARVDNPWPWQM